MMWPFLLRIFAFSVCVCVFVLEGPLRAKRPEAVSVVASQEFRIPAAKGSVAEPFLISLDWSQAQPQVTRAVIIFHGIGRDVEGYYRTALEAADKAAEGADGGGSPIRETVFIAPQFLDIEDISANRVPRDVLRWRGTDWEGGLPAAAPSPISSYDVVDALLGRLGDRSIFPNLRTAVLAGHSGGAQLVQRYAVVGRAISVLAGRGIHLRFVVANPSSYVYFSDERPAWGGTPDFYHRDACPRFNRWKYGILDAPAYVAQSRHATWAQMEADYAQQDVIYLLGTADTDPHHKDLDISCGAEAEGPTRFARGQIYYAYLHGRNPSGWGQRLWFVPGVGHSVGKMFNSTCGVAALFDGGPRRLISVCR